MSGYKIQHTIDAPLLSVLQKDSFLWVWYANKIPPHIGVSNNGYYYSLKVNGKDEKLPVEKLIDIIKKKEIFILIFRVENKLSLVEIVSFFNKYSSTKAGEVTCLTPIIELWKTDENIEKLSDLLVYLSKNNKIKEVYSYNKPVDFEGIPSYGREDIEKRLVELENAKRTKNIS